MAKSHEIGDVRVIVVVVVVMMRMEVKDLHIPQLHMPPTCVGSIHSCMDAL